MIQNHNWEFIFLGADIDSYDEAASIGIKRSNVANYRKTSKGIHDMYESVDNAILYCKNDMKLDESWKEKLEE